MPEKLPWVYWPIFLAGLLLVMLLAAAIAVTLGLNPYVAMAISGGVWTLRETWIAQRKRPDA